MKKIISIISVITLLCTMFYLPVMAETASTNVMSDIWTTVVFSNHTNNNAATYGYTVAAAAGQTNASADGHILASVNMGTHVNKGIYYRNFGADSFAAPKPVATVFGDPNGKLCVGFTPFGSIWNKFKALTYGANDRMYFSTYVNNLSGNEHELCFMPSSAGVNMTNFYKYTFPKNRWTKLDVVYNPNVTYTYTVTTDGATEKVTASTLGKVIPQGSNYNSKYPASSAGDEKASSRWTPILALSGSTYDANSTYVMEKVQFGEVKIYIDGVCVYTNTNSKSYSATSTDFYFYDSLPSRFVFNKNGALALSNMKFGKITNFDVDTFSTTQPELIDVAGKYSTLGSKIYTSDGILNKSDIIAPQGSVVKVYSKDSDVTLAGEYKYTELTDEVIPEGSIVSVQEDKDGGERISYEVLKTRKFYEYTNAFDAKLSAGNASVSLVGGLAGKGADDKANQLIPSVSGGKVAVDPFMNMPYGMDAEVLRNFTGYIHMSYNMLTQNLYDDYTRIRLTGEQGAIIAASNERTVLSKVLENDKWTKIDIVFDLEGGKAKLTDKNKTNGTYKLYVNGALVDSGNTMLGAYNGSGNLVKSLRLGVQAGNNYNTACKIYFDDFKFYATYVDEPVPTALPQVVTANVGDTVSSVTAQGAKVYTDASYKVQPSDSDVLRNGNVIVVENDGTYAYYDVFADGVKHYMTSSDSCESYVRFAPDWSVSGIGGKAADDYSLKLTKVAGDVADYQNMYPQFVYNRGEDAKDYTVIALKLFVPDDATTKDFGIYSQGHQNLGQTISNADISKNKWIEIVDVIDYTGEDVVATMYIDGKVYNEPKREIGKKKVNDVLVDFGASGYNQIRLSFNTGVPTSTPTIYMDDIMVYETDEEFVPANLLFEDAYSAKADLTDGDKLYVSADATVADIKAVYPDANVIRDNAQVEDTAALEIGDTVIVAEAENYVMDSVAFKSAVVAGNYTENDGLRFISLDGVKAGDIVKCRVVAGGVLVVAGYGADGAMASIDTDMTSSASYKSVTVPEANTVSFIAIDGFENLKPVSKNFDIVLGAE